MLIAILLVGLDGDGWGNAPHATIVFSEMFPGSGSLPAGWSTFHPPGMYAGAWNDVNGCGGAPVGSVACSEAPAYSSVYQILESPVINLPSIPSGQNVWLSFRYGSHGNGHFLLGQISVLVGGNWSPYTTFLMPVSNGSGLHLSSLNRFVSGASAMRLRFIHSSDTLKGTTDSGYVYIDSLIVFIDSVSRPAEDTSSACCNLVYGREGAFKVRPDRYWWDADSVPYSTDNYIFLCNPCSTLLMYRGTLFVNGGTVHDSTYTFPPDTCILVQWDTISLNHGSNLVEFSLSPLEGPACGPIDLATSVYIFTDTTSNSGGPPSPPWCPIEPCIVDSPFIFDTLLAVYGIDIGICDVVACTDTVFPPTGTPPTYRMGASIRTIYDPGLPDTLLIRMFIYEPEGDTVADTILTHVTAPDGTVVDIIILMRSQKVSSNARIGIHFLNAPLSLYPVPMEYVDADSIMVLLSDWVPLSSLGIRAYPYVGLLLVEPSTGGMEFLPGGDRRRVMVDMASRRIRIEGSGRFVLATVSGRVVYSVDVVDGAEFSMDNLAPGIYLYRFGGIGGRLLIR